MLCHMSHDKINVGVSVSSAACQPLPDPAAPSEASLSFCDSQ